MVARVSKSKDIVALGALAVVSFPVVLLGVLLWTGNVRMVFGPETQDPLARAKLLERPEEVPGGHPTADSGAKRPSDSGLQARSEELDRREADIGRMNDRVQMQQQEDERVRDTIRMERQRLESMLGKEDSLETVRVTVLASTFTGMKADQAGKILCSLDDVLTTAILRRIQDDKSRGKILAAMGKHDVQKAARISRLLAAAPVVQGAQAGNKEHPSRQESHSKPAAPAHPDSTRKNVEKKP